MFSNKEYVLAVYRQKSFSKAAQELYISQPSLSATIKRLEAKLGSPIFDRSTKSMRLTEAGTAIYQAAKKMQGTEKEVSMILTDIKHLLAQSPLLPSYHAAGPGDAGGAPAEAAANEPLDYRRYAGGLVSIGRDRAMPRRAFRRCSP